MNNDRVIDDIARAELQDTEMAENFVQASKAVSYGLDTASRVYGLDMLLVAVQNIDETGRDAKNPLGAVYERLAPTKEAQQDLYREMRCDLARPQRAAFDLPAAENTLRVGRNAHGEFFEKNLENGWPEPDHEVSIQMIRALKSIIKSLDDNSCFSEVRKEAQTMGLTPLEYLVQGEINPTLSFFLQQASAAIGIEIEELLAPTMEVEEDNDDGCESVESKPESELGDIEEAELGEICDLDNAGDEVQDEVQMCDVVQSTIGGLMESKWLDGTGTFSEPELDDETDDDIDVDRWFEATMKGNVKIKG